MFPLYFYKNTINKFLLDKIDGASVGYSLRKISSSATNAIRVRRDNDNEEQDIGFVGSELDTVSLLSFAGSNSTYVTTWYDQSGNGNHATQSTADNQPCIVNTGTIETDSQGNYTTTYDGTNDYMQALNISCLSGNAVRSFASVVQMVEAPTDNTTLFDLGGGTLAGTEFRVTPEPSYRFNGSYTKFATPAFVQNELTQIAGIYDGTINPLNWINGTSREAVINTLSTELNSSGNLYIGTGRGGSGIFLSNQKMNELIVFDTVLSDLQRQNVESNQMKYYSL